MAHNMATKITWNMTPTALHSWNSEGYCVIRIWNNELFADPRAVADFVFEKAKKRLPGGTEK